jgi:hypothetical protein
MKAWPRLFFFYFSRGGWSIICPLFFFEKKRVSDVSRAGLIFYDWRIVENLGHDLFVFLKKLDFQYIFTPKHVEKTPCIPCQTYS